MPKYPGLPVAIEPILAFPAKEVRVNLFVLEHHHLSDDVWR
jgi:hypothetical protein